METLPPAEAVRRIEGDAVAPTVPPFARSEGPGPFASTIGGSPLSFPILPPTLASLTSNMPMPGLGTGAPNLALELALRRIALQNPQPSSSVTIALAAEALRREQAQLTPALPPDLLVRPGRTERFPLAPPPSTAAIDHQIAMLLKNYYG